MSDFLGNLAARTLGLAPTVRPWLAARFEPAQGATLPLADTLLEWEAAPPANLAPVALPPASAGSLAAPISPAPTPRPGRQLRPTLGPVALTDSSPAALFAPLDDSPPPPATAISVAEPQRAGGPLQSPPPAVPAAQGAIVAALPVAGTPTAALPAPPAPRGWSETAPPWHSIPPPASEPATTAEANRDPLARAVAEPPAPTVSRASAAAMPAAQQAEPPARADAPAAAPVAAMSEPARSERPTVAAHPPPAPPVARPQVRAAPPAAAPTGVPPDAAPPTIHVTIGRIEIKATPPATVARPRSVAPAPAPALSLDSYLRGRSGGAER